MRQPIVFGKYLLLERISVGGMAEVFKAKSFGEEGFEKILAIKRILPSMAEDEDFITMFIDEAKISGLLSHPNIGQIYELGEIEGAHFIAMEYVWGKDVLQIQNRFRRLRQKMPLTMAAYIASRVCEGLDYAHRKKDEEQKALHIIHRDVSPQNVLVSYAGEVKIIDFGIAHARSRSSKTQAGVLKGKFGYMSPEQVRALPLDHRSDVFAIGTLLYEMVTGERLFTGESDFATLERVRNAQVIPPSRVDPRVPKPLEDIILKALRRDAEDRYQWASEMQEEVTAWYMSQVPLFTSKTLAATVIQIFDPERKREEASLDDYRQISRQDLPKYSQQPVIRRSAPAISLLGSGHPLPAAAVAESDEDDATQIGSPFWEGDDSIEQVLSDSQLEVVISEEISDLPTGSGEQHTEIFGDLPASVQQGAAPEMTAEPTFIFNSESGQLLQLPEQSTVILSHPGNGQSQGSEDSQPDQGPTVIFDAGLSAAIAAGGDSTQGHPSGTMPISIETKPGSVVKDVLIGVLLAMVVILGVVLWKGLGSLRKPTQQLATLVVTATPSRQLEVLLDGVVRGQMKGGIPFTLKQIPPKAYQVMLRGEGVEPVTRQVMLAAGDVKVVSLSLKVARAIGHLKLLLDPPEARVFLDGAEVATEAVKSPLELQAGTGHEVKVTHEGYTAEILQVTVAPRQVLEKAVKLEREQGGDKLTNLLLTNQPKPQSHKKPPQPQSRKKPSQPQSHKKPPQPEADKGKAAAEKKPDPPLTKTPPHSSPHPGNAGGGQKPAGEDGPAERAQQPKEPAKPEPGKQEAATVAATPSGKREGYLVANTTPWSRVYIDGNDTGKTTPVAPRQKIALEPGTHKVTFETQGKRFDFTVRISSGRTTTLIKRLPLE